MPTQLQELRARNILNYSNMATQTQERKQAIVAELQQLGVQNVNPQASLATLEQILEQNKNNTSNATITLNTSSTQTGPTSITITPQPKSDTERILDAVAGIAVRLDKVEKEQGRMKDKGVNDFKMDVKDEDVAAASANKSTIDPKIVRIVENTLGVDFGMEVEGFSDKPGTLLHIMVPKRLSPVPTAFRPVRDLESGKYKVDPKTQQVIEEEYWPGDRRSLSMGVASSYEMVQQHCNRVRSYIIKEYQKRNQPIPEFKIN